MDILRELGINEQIISNLINDGYNEEIILKTINEKWLFFKNELNISADNFLEMIQKNIYFIFKTDSEISDNINWFRESFDRNLDIIDIIIKKPEFLIGNCKEMDANLNTLISQSVDFSLAYDGVLSAPKILMVENEQLENTILVLKKLNLNIDSLLKKAPAVFSVSVERITSVISMLQKISFDDVDILKLIEKRPLVLQLNPETIEFKINILSSYFEYLENEAIILLVLSNPKLLFSKEEKINKILFILEKEFDKMTIARMLYKGNFDFFSISANFLEGRIKFAKRKGELDEFLLSPKAFLIPERVGKRKIR